MEHLALTGPGRTILILATTWVSLGREGRCRSEKALAVVEENQISFGPEITRKFFSLECNAV